MRHSCGALLVLLLAGADAAAQDWTEWRGPSRDGTVPAAVVPAAWPAGVARAWHVEVGEGGTWSLPVLLPDGLLVREAAGLTRLTWQP